MEKEPSRIIHGYDDLEQEKQGFQKTLIKLPQIKIESVDEKTGETTFDVDDNFVKMVQLSLNLDREPTEEEVGAFLKELLNKAAEEKDGYKIETAEKLIIES